jgi:tetratricopeptide (TPR) repeat protein
MTNRQTDILFQLIKSLEKAEKRHFKLFIQRSSSRENLKIVLLFDALDKLKAYDEAVLLKKIKSIRKPQLANLKTHLYKQVLASLRLLKTSGSLDLQLNEQYDFAHILYKKGLYIQSLKILERVKETAMQAQKFNFLTRVIAMEKRIESLHITRSSKNRSEELSQEAIEVAGHVNSIALLSNLSIQMYGWYIKKGHARNEREEKGIKNFVSVNLAKIAMPVTGFYGQMYLYQSKCWEGFICQHFLQYYRYAQKWVNLFQSNPSMIRAETGHYIKGMHHLLNAHFDLRNYDKFKTDLVQLENFAKTKRVMQNDIFRIQSFLYIQTAKINQHSMLGTFKEGLKNIPEINNKLQEYAMIIDKHRVLVLNYKIAMLYFGSGEYSLAIDYLHKIINEPVELRTDLHCYARLVHLLAHYEMGNEDILDYQVKSVYRFMSKMENLTLVEEEMFRFLRKAIGIKVIKIKPELEKLLHKVKHLEKNRFQTRAFAYLDVISWLESKVYNRSMSEILQERYKNRKKRGF